MGCNYTPITQLQWRFRECDVEVKACVSNYNNQEDIDEESSSNIFVKKWMY